MASLVLLFGSVGTAHAGLLTGASGDDHAGSEWVFGFSGGTANFLNLTLSDSSVMTLSTAGGDASGFRQGWWSATFANGDSNSNYFTGDIVSSGPNTHNNFFTFELPDLGGLSVVSASLDVIPYDTFTDTGRPFQTYVMYDVSTDATTLNANDGTNAAIFTDLETGVSYGTHNFPIGFVGGYITIGLNAAAVADINAALGGDFSIGGTLQHEAVPEPTSMTLLGLGALSLAGYGYRRRQKGKVA
jgi:hypothetical protein